VTLALRIVAGVGVLALAGVLGWRLAHQDTKVAKAVAHGKVVPAPVFRLPRLGGGPRVSLAAYRGKAVVVNFWASDCIPCKKEMPRLQAASKRWAANQVAVVGVDVLDSRAAARDFAHSHGVTYTIGVDPLGDLASRYGVAYTPTTFFVDRRGRIVKRILGPVSDSELDAQIERALST
jgi:cytochrome c biogenesis protein CcmG, thiol:disulfide interchange protein DsbE